LSPTTFSSRFRLRPALLSATAISAATLTALATATVPAYADDDAVWLGSSFGASAIAVGSAGKSVPVWYSATAGGNATLPPTVSATIDTSASQAVQISLSSYAPGCTQAGTLITCQRATQDYVEPRGDLRLLIRPTAGAAVGDHAQLTITVTAPGVETSVRPVDLTVTEPGVDLQVGNSSSKTTAPGGTATARPWVRNSGDRTAKTVLFAMSGGSYTKFPVHYRNCNYQTDDYGFEKAVCLLKNVRLAPGETLTPASSTPLPLQVKTNVPGQLRINRLDRPGQPYQTYLSYDVAAYDTTPVDDRLSWPAGNGPNLVWQRSTAPAAAKLTNNTVDSWDDWGSMNVTVSPNNPTDTAASGITLQGHVGDLVTAPVGIRNYGPAAISATPEAKGGDAADPYNAGLRFVPPANTEVVDVTLPDGYYYQDWREQDTATGKSYLVLPYSLADGADYQVKFTLRIIKAGTGTGTVTSQGGVHDPASANNVANVTVSAS
jgi:hypothetical protein